MSSLEWLIGLGSAGFTLLALGLTLLFQGLGMPKRKEFIEPRKLAFGCAWFFSALGFIVLGFGGWQYDKLNGILGIILIPIILIIFEVAVFKRRKDDC